MISEIFIAALCFAVVAAFLCGEMYGRAQERKLQDRRRRPRVVADPDSLLSTLPGSYRMPMTLREISWHGIDEGSDS